eukprot:TRINITY_DN10186_c0_g1_i1.p1 TRINITY_DN10186_c0_g1~~TRINITY_DN10186_c0_g1_i1.p1  ORF type:complete len:1028 (+),score=316.09 TRINITY_DN10186_c0_g1_i1:137-3085(+)
MKKIRRTIELLLVPVKEKEHAQRLRSMLENLKTLDLSNGGAQCATEIMLVDARKSYAYVPYAQGVMKRIKEFDRENGEVPDGPETSKSLWWQRKYKVCESVLRDFSYRTMDFMPTLRYDEYGQRMPDIMDPEPQNLVQKAFGKEVKYDPNSEIPISEGGGNTKVKLQFPPLRKKKGDKEKEKAEEEEAKIKEIETKIRGEEAKAREALEEQIKEAALKIKEAEAKAKKATDELKSEKRRTAKLDKAPSFDTETGSSGSSRRRATSSSKSSSSIKKERDEERSSKKEREEERSSKREEGEKEKSRSKVSRSTSTGSRSSKVKKAPEPEPVVEIVIPPPKEEEEEEVDGSWDCVSEDAEQETTEIDALQLEIERIRAIEKAAKETTPCPNCSAGNDFDAKFCNQCGSNMKGITVIQTNVRNANQKASVDSYDGFTKEELEEDMKALEEEEQRQKQAKSDHKNQSIELFLETPNPTEPIPSSLFNTAVLNAMNYWNFPQMKKALTGLLSLNEIEILYKMRFANGGVFWGIEELFKAFKVMKKRPDLVIAAIYPKIEIDASLLSIITPQLALNCNSVKSITDGRSSLANMLKIIKGAKNYINLAIGWFFNDKFGNLIARALMEKAKQGVTVRILLDEINKSSYSNFGNSRLGTFAQLKDQFQAAGVLTIFVNLPKLRDSVTWGAFKGMLAKQGVPEIFTDLRDSIADALASEDTGKAIISTFRQKFMVVDDEVAWVGSLNIGDEYINDEAQPSTATWLDGLVLVESDHFAVRLNYIFAFQWVVWGGANFACADPSIVIQPKVDQSLTHCAILLSYPGAPVNLNREYYYGLLTLASGEVNIHSPYLLDEQWWKILDDPKKVDAHSSVGSSGLNKVSITTCLAVNDQAPAIQSITEVLKNDNIEVYDYSSTGRFSHWNVIVDNSANTVYTGSYYPTKRVDHDLGVLVKSPAFASSVLQQLNTYARPESKVTAKSAPTVATKNLLQPYF